MTTVYMSGAVADTPQATATHVLVIGTGAYPNLKNTKYSGIQPLGCPVVSAKAVADWFLNSVAPAATEAAFCNPDAELGSVELLFSPAGKYSHAAVGDKDVDAPTKANIDTSFDRWLQRLGQNADSHGVFYFCGHGLIDGQDQVVLADDFGAQGNDKLWTRAFNVSTTVLGVIRRTRASVFFFVDACMEFSKDLAFQQGILPQALLDLDASIPPLTTEWQILRAATPGRPAFAPADGVSYFTAALLRALSGFCGKQAPGRADFVVAWPQLREATADFLELDRRGSRNKQSVSDSSGGSGTVALHVLRQPPNVLFELDVKPPGYRPAARVYLTNTEVGRKEADLKAGGPAQIVVPQASYDLGAEATDGTTFPPKTDVRLILAPYDGYTFLIP